MNNDNITSLGAARAIKAHDNRLWTPIECLSDTIEEEKKTPSDKLVIIRIDTKGGDVFSVGYSAAGIKCSEILAAIEILKFTLMKEMGYTS
jgi:hypothetical protein